MKRLIQVLISAIILVLFWMNGKLYYEPDFRQINGQTINLDLLHQLNFLKERLHDGEGARMQQQFPEGFIFLNVLYGLSWSNFLMDVESDALDLYQKGINEIDWAIKEVLSPEGQRIFKADLPLAYGAFYRGWTNYLIANKLLLDRESRADSIQVNLFTQNCQAIAAALDASALPYLESYAGQTWPADMMTGVLSLKIHDQLFEPLYEETISLWLQKISASRDPYTGLIPHMVSGTTGEVYQGARGSSQSLILTLLSDIDEEMAKADYEVYQQHFLDRRFGLYGIREYPKGIKGNKDVDSGPVIWGIGGSASIVGQRAAGKLGDWKIYKSIRNSVEVFGVPLQKNAQKQYIFGKLPMADAFIAWSNSLENVKQKTGPISNWRWRFHLLTMLIIGVLLFTLIKL